MKNYIKPEAEVYKVGIVSPLCESGTPKEPGQIDEGDAKVHDYFLFPDFVIVSPKSLRQRVLLFSDVLPSALFGCKSPCSEVA